MKRAPRSRQRHDLYAKYHDYDSEISDLLGECGTHNTLTQNAPDTKGACKYAHPPSRLRTFATSTVDGQCKLLVPVAQGDRLRRLNETAGAVGVILELHPFDL